MESVRFLAAAAIALVCALLRGPALCAAEPPVNLSNPVREYVEGRVLGWKLFVEKQLADEDPDLQARAAARLEKKLGEVLRALPPHTHEQLQGLPIFLLYGEKSRSGGRNNGAEYFQRIAPQHFPHLDPRMGSSIVIYSAANYVWLSELWAAKVLLHELAHAWQLENWPERQEDILQAYESAMGRGLYRDVREDTGQLLGKSYATANQLEYFAELSCAYFTGCNYHPSDREHLREYDPAGLRMVEKMWSLRPAPRPPESGPGPASGKNL